MNKIIANKSDFLDNYRIIIIKNQNNSLFASISNYFSDTEEYSWFYKEKLINYLNNNQTVLEEKFNIDF